MEEKEYHITVNDNAFKMRNSRLFVVLLFLGCFFCQFVIYCLLEHTGVIVNTYIEEYMPEIAMLVSVAVICLYYHIREKKTKAIMDLTVNFMSDFVKIIIYDTDYIVKYSDIKEVSKTMVIDRVHDKKGCYRLKIKCRGTRNFEFETTEQEYEKHLDFEDTELFVFYSACRKAGLKCC